MVEKASANMWFVTGPPGPPSPPTGGLGPGGAGATLPTELRPLGDRRPRLVGHRRARAAQGVVVALAGRVPGVDRELLERMVAAVDEIGALTGPEGVRATALAWVRTLGEAAAQISPQLKQRRPEVPWGRLTGLSTLVADTPVADELVEQFATRELPLIDMQLRSVLGSLR